MKYRKYFVIAVFILLLSFFKLDNVSASTNFTMARVNATELSVRNAAGSGTRITDTDNQTIWLYRPRVVEIIGSEMSGGLEWKKISFNYYSNNYVGWVAAKYLNDIKSYTTDDNYGNSLRSAGFPESYILPLQKLHAVHPNWNFVPSKYENGLDFSYVIEQEAYPVNKNLIDGSTTSLRSTDGAAYSNGVYYQFEKNWYAASKQTIAFFIDPRNWFNDNTIFMFEQLSYNSALHTEAAVQQALNGTFMSGSYQYNGNTLTYAKTFVDAGIQKNVSPIHLASRVIQEQGASGNSITINMQSDGKTYFNYYNINATGSSPEIIAAKALDTAKRRGWDNQYSAIVDGASTIANGYINGGQDTLYYQKFNTISGSSLFSHQYMANVRVLPSEAYRIFTSYYNSGVIENNFIFKIPVYINMPDATTLSTSQNGDNTLKSLIVTGCNLKPEFTSAATEYTCNVANTTNQVTISAEKSSMYASMSGDGVIILNNNETTTEIVVTASNGDKRVYRIKIKKVEPGKESPADIISSLNYNNSNNILSGIPIDKNISEIVSSVTNNYPLASIVVKDKNNNNKTDGIVATGDKIIITSNGITTEFTISIRGDANGDGKISISDYAKVKSHILGISKMSGVFEIAADANNDGKISISDYAKIKSHILGISKINQ